MERNVVLKLVNVSVRQAGWDINVIDRAMKIITGKIVSNYAIVEMQEHVMHKTEHALVEQVGLVKPAIQNANLECLALIVHKNANVILITQFIVMEAMAVVFVKRCGEVSLRNFVCKTQSVAIFCSFILTTKKYCSLLAF